VRNVPRLPIENSVRSARSSSATFRSMPRRRAGPLNQPFRFHQGPPGARRGLTSVLRRFKSHSSGVDLRGRT